MNNIYLKLERTFSEDVSAPVLEMDGRILVPRTIYTPNFIQVVDIEQGEDYVRISVAQVDYSLQVISKKFVLHTYKLQGDKIIYESNRNLIPKWFNSIWSHKDLIKNPNNRGAWHKLNPKDIPIYDSNNIFVTSNGDLYINTDCGWILVNRKWFNESIYRFPQEVQDEYNMLRAIVKF